MPSCGVRCATPPSSGTPARRAPSVQRTAETIKPASWQGTQRSIKQQMSLVQITGHKDARPRGRSMHVLRKPMSPDA